MFLGFHEAFTLSATCDNNMAVYIDGVRATPRNGEEDNWKSSSDYSLNACNSLIAISCEETGGAAGILASTTTGVLTDTTWRCTDLLETGWDTVGFTETAGVWGTPDAHGRNGVARGGAKFTDINLSSKWIWFGPNDGTRKTVYCRKNI